MLLDLTVSNFRSINQPVSFNLVPGREQKGSAQLPYLKKYRRKVNPVAALFGANGSGKSNILAALTAFRELLHPSSLPGTPLNYQPFLLDDDSRTKPTVFEVLFCWNETLYEYIISYTREAIHSEHLTRLTSRSEVTIFSRDESHLFFHGHRIDPAHPSGIIETLLATAPAATPIPTYFAASSPRLTDEESRRKIKDLTAVFTWAGKVLVVDTRASRRLDFYPYRENWKHIIPDIDAGIVGVIETEVAPSSLRLSPGLLTKIEDELHSRDARHDLPTMEIENAGERYKFSLHDGRISIHRIAMVHEGHDDFNAPLSWENESDGTKSAARLISQVSALVHSREPFVLAIDELDKSFHTELSRALLDGFLEACNPGLRSQLIFTTHDLMLMDPQRLRKDQIWLVEKRAGATTLTVLSEFDGLRSDKDIRKAYLQGRLGAVPAISPLPFQAKG
ncbi:hypothetical protein HMPREF1219_01933 [Corynebacterium pyruviciproducens ATCC BAA-1742]|uniref:ATPase AAA-type core domain-containing protein n=1 Tax=Corynebacterium pyruviciproducens ATCC BAA-1742 TaxID=1125779 RepID=S2ZE77_9CORY|nr:ATP-binding protein [Corynebacterium pyruviciproducens]EPD68287.1 hypothetical protein HMPREF1219_01933 [Corynebacterium pyruviciproducens ATCC BAA-1742]